MHLELNEEQLELLRATIDSTVRDLSYEIASADLPAFRRLLRHRREVLRQVLDAVGGPIPPSPRAFERASSGLRDLRQPH